MASGDSGCGMIVHILQNNMDVYFIRHGQTDYNRRHWHQPFDIPLSEQGRRQAATLTTIIEQIAPTHAISSPALRAVETTSIALSRTTIIPDTNPLFFEVKRSRALDGSHHFSPRSLRYMLHWFLDTDDVTNDQTGGESRDEFLARIIAARTQLEALPLDARVVVFSHTVFINYFVEHLCKEEHISFAKAVWLLFKIKKLDNSSITQVRYDPTLTGNVCKWSLVSFDNDAHVVT